MSFKCVEGRLNPLAKKHQFEIFGYDFMIDQNLCPWLIEINTNPCIEETSALLKMYLPRMINDCFKLTLDPLFPPPKEKELEGKEQLYKIENHPDGDNLWQHIYTMKP
jgi:hypothetical protein